MVEIHRGRSKRRFSESPLKKQQSYSPFAALSNIKRMNSSKYPPQTPPPKASIASISALSASASKRKKSPNPLRALTMGFRPKTPPPTGSRKNSDDKKKKKKKKKQKIRSRSPLSMVLQKTKSMKTLNDNQGNSSTPRITSMNKRATLKNPSLSLEAEDIDGLLAEQNTPFSDDELIGVNKNEQHLAMPVRSPPAKRRRNLHKSRSLSEDDIKFKTHRRMTSLTLMEENKDGVESKSVMNLDITDDNFHEDLIQKLKKGDTLNTLPDEEEDTHDESEIMKQLEDDIDKQIESDASPKEAPMNGTENKLSVFQIIFEEV